MNLVEAVEKDYRNSTIEAMCEVDPETFNYFAEQAQVLLSRPKNEQASVTLTVRPS